MRDKGNLRLRLSLLTHAFASGDIGSKVRFAETEGTTRRWGPGEARPRREIESRDPIGGDRNGGGGVGRIDPRRVRVAGCRRPHRSPPRRREPGPHRRRATERPPATPPPRAPTCDPEFVGDRRWSFGSWSAHRPCVQGSPRRQPGPLGPPPSAARRLPLAPPTSPTTASPPPDTTMGFGVRGGGRCDRRHHRAMTRLRPWAGDEGSPPCR